MLFPLDGRQAYLKLTTAHYYLPNGQSIHRDENSKTWGVDPDVTVRLTPEQMSKAIQARRALDVLHEANAGDKDPTTRPGQEALQADPQLAAALLLLRVQLAGV
jgi:C-terminal processing protease CtpA/Prc